MPGSSVSSRLARTAGHVITTADTIGPSAAANPTGAASSLSIGYWDIRGLGAPLRMMAEFAGVPFEAKLFDSDTDDWATYKVELIKINPFANLPFVVDGDTVITQSNACMDYLGNKFGLLGADEAERALVEQCLCQVMDLRNDAVALFYGNAIAFSDPPIAHPATDAERYCESIARNRTLRIILCMPAAAPAQPFMQGRPPSPIAFDDGM